MNDKYTAEQIDACILCYKSGDLNYCRQGIIDLLSSYAALLREREAAKAGVTDVVRDVMDELNKAIAKFPTWPTDPLHAVGVVNEETGELCKAVLQQVYEPHKNNPGDVRKEALQAAAMVIRFLASLNRYEWAPGTQHQQPTLAAAPKPEKE